MILRTKVDTNLLFSVTYLLSLTVWAKYRRTLGSQGTRAGLQREEAVLVSAHQRATKRAIFGREPTKCTGNLLVLLYVMQSLKGCEHSSDKAHPHQPGRPIDLEHISL